MREKNRIILAALFSFFMLVACDDNPPEKTEAPYKPFDKVQLIAHGGDCVNCPVNTMPAFESAVNNLGLRWIETDPQLTKDGTFVLFHDTTLNNYTNEGGYLKDYEYSELLGLDFGQAEKFGEAFRNTKICTLEEAIVFAKTNNVILELDFGHFDVTDENVRKLWDLACKYEYEGGVIFEPYNESHLNIIKEVSTKINIIYVGCDKSLEFPEQLDCFDFVVIGLNYLKVGDETELARKIHEKGFKAASSVINPVPENPVKKMNELINMGFDYIYVDSIPYSEINALTE